MLDVHLFIKPEGDAILYSPSRMCGLRLKAWKHHPIISRSSELKPFCDDRTPDWSPLYACTYGEVTEVSPTSPSTLNVISPPTDTHPPLSHITVDLLIPPRPTRYLWTSSTTCTFLRRYSHNKHHYLGSPQFSATNTTADITTFDFDMDFLNHEMELFDREMELLDLGTPAACHAAEQISLTAFGTEGAAVLPEVLAMQE